MIESSRIPGRCRMTSQTIVVKSSCHMVRIRHTGEVRLMAAVTIGWNGGELAVGVTIDTRYCGMRTRQREIGIGMIEC